MPTVSFAEETYSVAENVPKLNVTVVRSGDINSSVTVQIANHPFDGTATGKLFLLFMFPPEAIMSHSHPSLLPPSSYLYSPLHCT